MKHFDIGSIIVIVITFIIFALALFFRGFTHDLLLEAGVFLVSVKLIIMAYKSSASSENIHRELEEIKEILKNKTQDT
jgi:flagellar motor component MotA